MPTTERGYLLSKNLAISTIAQAGDNIVSTSFLFIVLGIVLQSALGGSMMHLSSLQHQGQKLTERFDANTYIGLTHCTNAS
ncbi:hypothetical protein [Nostoc foliaceum]|uniref:Uncharacterized protein n=1 Tax=Nostoc linckia FACHB-391 TaxID=2692906 RepID=A0ABR8EZD2_NOSLI|nr:hypothetical protein [Nostoc foliaceum]MBD2561985.1 hypothetical protein [Nostoc linckia FACHB-391]